MYYEYKEVVVCKYCGNQEFWANMVWLNGKCMCPRCYENEKRIQDILRR